MNRHDYIKICIEKLSTLRNAASDILPQLNNWEEIKNACFELRDQHLPQREKRRHKPWIKKEILQLNQSRRRLKHNPQQYKAIDQRIRKACLQVKADFIEKKRTELENLEYSSPKECHERIREFTGKFSECPSSAHVTKDGNGRSLFEKLDVRNTWKQYIQDLYSDNSRKQMTIKFSGEVSGQPILKEVVSAPKKTPKGRASRRDELPEDLYKTLNEVGAETQCV